MSSVNNSYAGPNTRYGQGEVKIPGGKLVRVTVQQHDHHESQAIIDGDFFLEEESSEVLDRAQQILNEQLADLPHDWENWQADEYFAYYRRLADRLTAVLADVLVGVNGEAIALAFVRALLSGTTNEHAREQERAFEQIRETRVKQQVERAQTGTARAEQLISAEEIARRWSQLSLEVFVDIPRMPAEEMRVDKVWAEQVAAGQRPPTLRFWNWAAPAVVCGKYQSIADEVNLEYAREQGIQIVRRDTGGGAMFIEPANTITFSLYAPLSFVDGLDARQSFQLCDAWLIKALADCGISAHYAGLNDIASDRGKIGGAAERRFAGDPGCLLHHDTLAYGIDTEKMSKVLRVSAEKMSDKAVKSASKRVDPMNTQTSWSRERIVNQMERTAREFSAKH